MIRTRLFTVNGSQAVLLPNGVMPAPLTPHTVLTRFRKSLDEIYGQSLDRVVLFGSHARGDARPDSDYDVAIFLKDPGPLWDELGRLAHVTTKILYDTGAVISAKPFAAELYSERSPLMQEIRADGVDL
jgi:uncharacterized protein